MAYANKETKAKVVEAVKAVLPKDWKATFAVLDSMKIVCTIRKAPLDLVEVFGTERDYYTVNEYHFRSSCKDSDVADILEKIINALNCDNHNNSDSMIDYYDVGYYIDLQFGSWDKPFTNTK